MQIVKYLKERCLREMSAPSTLNSCCTCTNNEYKTIRVSVVILTITRLFLNFSNLCQFIYVFYISKLTCFYVLSIRIHMIKNQFLLRTLFRFFSTGFLWSYLTVYGMKTERENVSFDRRTGGDYTQLKKI